MSSISIAVLIRVFRVSIISLSNASWFFTFSFSFYQYITISVLSSHSVRAEYCLNLIKYSAADLFCHIFWIICTATLSLFESFITFLIFFLNLIKLFIYFLNSAFSESCLSLRYFNMYSLTHFWVFSYMYSTVNTTCYVTVILIFLKMKYIWSWKSQSSNFSLYS